MSLLIIGELGEVFKLDHPSDLRKCVDLYTKRLNLENNDIYILDKNGKTIYFNAMNEINYDSKFFIFNKTFYKEQLIRIFEENLEKFTNTYSSSTSIQNLSTNLYIENYTIQNTLFEQNSKIFEKYGFSMNELKKINDTLLESFESSKLVYKTLKTNNKICEKIRENYNYQYNSLECIYKNISILYEQCNAKHKELESDLIKFNDKNEKILLTFRESLDKLKCIEIHPKMQTTKEKLLIDIYFDESKMNVWKDKCVKSSEFITEKIKSKNEMIQSEKAKIRNEKNTNILQLKNDWNSIIVELESMLNEKEAVSQSIIQNIYDEIKNYYKLLSQLSDCLSLNDHNSLDDLFDKLKQIRNNTNIGNYKDMISSITINSNSLDEFSKKMKALLIKSSIKINLVFTNYHLIKKNLLEIMEKLEKYSKGLPQIEKDFAYLLNPSYFPQAYQASIIEIKRRIIFNKKISKDFDRLRQLITKENSNRKLFIQDYGKYLTHDYVPQLKFSDLKLTIEFSNNEELINLPNLLDEEEENMVNNNNLYLEYDECGENLISKNLVSSNYSNRLNSFDVDENIRMLNSKISELEISLRSKDLQIKNTISKLESKDRKITQLQSEIEKLSNSIESISENYSKQIIYCNNKYKEKNSECESLIKIINSGKKENCPMCSDSNNNEFQGWGNYVKDYYEKLNEKNKLLAKNESRYQELVLQISFIKKVFFSHMLITIENKNNEILNLKQEYESRLMNFEDFLSSERIRNDSNFIISNQINGQIQSITDELNKKNSIIMNSENKIKELNKIISNNETEIKKTKSEKEQLKKTIEDMKIKENNINIDLKLKENKYESLITENKNLEKQNETVKKNFNQLSEEIIQKIKENTNLKFALESKNKNMEDLEKSLDKIKLSHVETLNEVHKANQSMLEKINIKLDELTKELNDKYKLIEDFKFKIQELSTSNDKKSEEIKILKESLNKGNDVGRESSESILILKLKIEELQNQLNEKEKKLNELNELTKLFSTIDCFSSNTKNTTNDINFAISNINFNNLSKLCDVDDFINIKKLEKGIRTIFVPHSAGLYVSISLCSQSEEYENNKYYKCNAILNIETVDNDMRELLIDNSLIVIGRISKLVEHNFTTDNNPYQLPEDNSYILVELDKIDYVIGFQGEEMIFRNYLY